MRAKSVREVMNSRGWIVDPTLCTVEDLKDPEPGKITITKDATFGWWGVDHTNILNVIGRRDMRAKSIIITPVLNGFLVKVGCQEVVFTSLDKMTTEIYAYYTDPEAVEKAYVKSAVNKPGTGPGPGYLGVMTPQYNAKVAACDKTEVAE